MWRDIKEVCYLPSESCHSVLYVPLESEETQDFIIANESQICKHVLTPLWWILLGTQIQLERMTEDWAGERQGGISMHPLFQIVCYSPVPRMSVSSLFIIIGEVLPGIKIKPELYRYCFRRVNRKIQGEMLMSIFNLKKQTHNASCGYIWASGIFPRAYHIRHCSWIILCNSHKNPI